MSKDVKNDEKTYYSKLGIIPTSIDNIKRIIKRNITNTINSWSKNENIEKQTFHIIGPAGVGKTASAIQLAEELTEELKIKFNHIIIKSPVLSRDDFLCPFPVIDNGHSRFKMLYSDFVPLDENSYGLFIIDEFSRGDQNLQMLLWQIQNEYKVHTKDFPKGWFVLCLDNPDDQEYSMNYLEDAAGLRRTLHMYTEVSVQAFLNYAASKKFHNLVIEFISIHPEYLYDFDSQKIGMIYSNPASWERVSNILIGYGDENEIYKNFEDINSLISGLLNLNMTRMFLSYIKDKTDIKPSDIFFTYDKVRSNILKYAKNSNNIKMGQLIESFTTYLISTKPEYNDNELENVSKFLTDMPSDISVQFLIKINGLKRTSNEFNYATKLHYTLTKKSDLYKTKFFEAMKNHGKEANSK